MKKLTLGSVLLILLSACASTTADTSSDQREMGNPYSPGTGHYAGYEWAESTGGSCGDSNSDSFNEGCETYYEQARE